MSIPNLSLAMTDEELISLVRQDAEKYIVTFKTPKMFFHWTDASDITPTGKFNKEFATLDSVFPKYFNKVSRKIFRLRNPKDSDLYGPGLYLASDPFISRKYGGINAYGLIVGIINPDARVIVLNDSVFGKFPDNIYNEMKLKGCPVNNIVSLLETTNKTCTVFKQMFIGDDQFIDGRLYEWSSFTSQLPGCHSSDTMANLNKPADFIESEPVETIVAYSTNLMTEIRGFTHKTKYQPNDPLGNLILSYLKTNNNFQALKVDDISVLHKDQMNDSTIRMLSPSENEEFNQKYIWGCH